MQWWAVLPVCIFKTRHYCSFKNACRKISTEIILIHYLVWKISQKKRRCGRLRDGVDSDYFRPIFRDYYLRLQRSKHLEQFQIFPSLYYFPIDGSQFFGSKDIHCEQCLVKEHQNGSKSYSHQVLQGGIAHPDCSQVIPFMPEQIVNTDGTNKNLKLLLFYCWSSNMTI